MHIPASEDFLWAAENRRRAHKEEVRDRIVAAITVALDMALDAMGFELDAQQVAKLTAEVMFALESGPTGVE